MAEKRYPNLFLVGAMKSGTTSLHNYLAAHPEIFMSRKPFKEAQYFVLERNWHKGEDWYLGLFTDAGDAKYLGESSTDYSKLPHFQGVPERIARVSPHARILYLMRDPVERAVSQYWWEVQWCGEGRDMLSVLKSMSWLTDLSYYAMQLRPYIEQFGRENVMAVTTEELSGRPQDVMRGIFDWLGVNPDCDADGFGKRHNISPDKVTQLVGAPLLSRLRGGPVWNAVKRVVPLKARQRMLRKLSRPVARDNRRTEAAIEYLRPIQREQTAELSALLGRDFPDWKTLYGEEVAGQPAG